MATMPYFVISPSTVLGLIGLLKGPKPVPPSVNPAWRDLKVDVFIPARNEAQGIGLCLASLLRQTLTPHSVTVIDDNSSDGTADIAHAFCEANGVTLRIVRRGQAMGKTVGLRRGAEEADGDIEFVLDADTILESPNYLERLVEELYRVPGIATASGVVMPLRERDIKAAGGWPEVRAWRARLPQGGRQHRAWWHRALRAMTVMYREALYYFIQRIIYRGEQDLFGSINSPIGCGVAYRREYLKTTIGELAQRYGENMTTSEDIFFGLSFIDRGYRNIQVYDVTMRSTEPELQYLPRQLFLWSSAWLQSLWYMPQLLLSPFLANKRREQRKQQNKHANQRKVEDPYRWTWGQVHSKRFGRPIGWAIFAQILEKVTFPLALILMIVMQWWEALAVTVAAEALLFVLLMTVFGKEEKFLFILKGLAATPVRYLSIVFDLVTFTRFAFDVGSRRQSHWRK